MITNREENLEIDPEKEHELDSYLQQMQLKKLEKESSVKMMYQQCSHLPSFFNKFPEPKDLGKHQIFNYEFTPMQVSLMCMQIQGGKDLDDIYETQKKQKNEEQAMKNNQESEYQLERDWSIQIYKEL